MAVLAKLSLQAATATKVVPVPNLGKDAEIIIRKMTVGDQIRFHNWVRENDHSSDSGIETNISEFLMAKLVCCMVNEDGDYIAEMDEIPTLIKAMDSDTFGELVKASNDLNPPPKEDEVKEKKSKS